MFAQHAMRRFVFIAAITLSLTACGVDTTGLRAESSKQPMGGASVVATLTEYGDLECPACKQAQDVLVKPILAKYGSKLGFSFKHFPLSQHRYALEAAQASECAADQGKFWQFIDSAYEHQEQLSSTTLRDWAKTLGLDVPVFDRCVRSKIKQAAVLADAKQGELLGVNSTPTFFVNGVAIPPAKNTLGDLSAAIDGAIAQAEKTPL